MVKKKSMSSQASKQEDLHSSHSTPTSVPNQTKLFLLWNQTKPEQPWNVFVHIAEIANNCIPFHKDF